jgi:hypothetical protein
VLARLANVAAPEGQSSGWRLGWYLVRQPVWLVSQGFGVAVFLFTGVALYFGELAVVQPLLVIELIFVLALRRFRIHEDIPWKSWVAASMVCVGLGVFLAVATVHGGSREPKAIDWVITLAVWSAVAGLFVVASRRGSAAWKAGCLGAAAGVVWSVDASFVEQAANTLQDDGFFGLFTHWPLYSLLVTGFLGISLTQAAFQVGPLSASQPTMLIFDPLGSILLGVLIFGERLSHTTPAVVGLSLALLVMCLGVVLMSRWAPPSMEPISGDPMTIMRYGKRATPEVSN